VFARERERCRYIENKGKDAEGKTLAKRKNVKTYWKSKRG
jgi:hypothetical protein